MPMMLRLITVVELESFLKRARAIMSDDERAGIVTFLAANPEAGIPLGVVCARFASPARAAARVADIGRYMCLAVTRCRCFC